MIRSQGTRILRAMAEVLIRAEIAAGRAGRLPELLRRLVYCAVVPFRGVDEAISRSRQAEERAAVRG